jgi:DNA helicase HerA-like ATPase
MAKSSKTPNGGKAEKTQNAENGAKAEKATAGATRRARSATPAAPAPSAAPLVPSAEIDPPGKIFVGKSEKPELLTLALANRHGLVTGATGTGKTVTLQVLAEGFSRAGVPVFAADIKGDLSGIAMPGETKDFLVKRATEMGFTYEPDDFPVMFWDLFGEQGHPIRAAVHELGPLLLSRMLDLNEVQEGVLNIAYRVADETYGAEDPTAGLVDLKDLRSLIAQVSQEAAKLTTEYGNVATSSIGSIQRQLLVLENQGGSKFLGEPALDIQDFMRTDRDGRGYINILAADKLMGSPRLYATFLLWLMTELFQKLPEVGDPEKPKVVFFFDEAHLLFTDAPKALLDKIEQVVRLIRSKGVGVYFVTQNPLDVPDKVLAQLGNRVQHALRAFTPRDQKAVQTAAGTFRPNPKLDTARVIMELGKGEALVSLLEGNGTPSMVERTMIRPPAARMGPITPQERAAVIAKSPVRGKYDQAVDRKSIFELRQERSQQAQAEASGEDNGLLGTAGKWMGSIFGTDRKRGQTLTIGQKIAREITRTTVNQTLGTAASKAGKSVAGSVGGSVGRSVVRSILGSILKR